MMKEWFRKNRVILSKICFLFVGIFNLIRYSRTAGVSLAVIVFWLLYTFLVLFLTLRSFCKKRKGTE